MSTTHVKADPEWICRDCCFFESELTERYPYSAYRLSGYGPDGRRCVHCWTRHVENLEVPPSCIECGCLIDPVDVDDLEADYICMECDAGHGRQTGEVAAAS